MHMYRSSQHVAKLAARPGTRHQRKTASNYAGSSILLLHACLQPDSPPAGSHASKFKPDETPVLRQPRQTGTGSKREARATPSIPCLASRAAGCAQLFPLAHSLSCPLEPHNLSLFVLSFRRAAASSSTGKEGRRAGKIVSRCCGAAAGAVDNRCWFLLSAIFCSLPTGRFACA